MVNQRKSFAQCWPVIILVILSAQANCQQGLDKNNAVMVPNVKQREIRSRTNFVVTCLFQHTTAIDWILPEYLSRYKDVGEPHKALNL